MDTTRSNGDDIDVATNTTDIPPMGDITQGEPITQGVNTPGCGDQGEEPPMGETIPGNRGKNRDKSPPVETRFQKGKSGNPNGRPKMDADAVAILKAAGPAAAAELVRLAASAKNEKVRADCAERVLDRLYGRPTQPIDATVGGNGIPVSVAFEGVLNDWSK